MGNLWLKIKIWTKVTVFFLVLLYVLIFVAKNSSLTVEPWLWFNKRVQTSVLLLALYAFVGGVILTILVRTTFKTISQIRDMRMKGRADRIEREMAEMRAKAAMLRAKPQTPVVASDETDTAEI